MQLFVFRFWISQNLSVILFLIRNNSNFDSLQHSVSLSCFGMASMKLEYGKYS